MKEYAVVTADSADELAGEVDVWLKDGWRPLGGVAISSVFTSVENMRKGYTDTSIETTYAQAMTR